MQLTPEDSAILAGEAGPGRRMAMELVVAVAQATGTDTLVDITQAHIDGCLYHGEAGIDFARRLLDGGASVAVPTTLNVSSLDLLHPDLFKGDAATERSARNLMDIHVSLGCRPTWTCAPYQLPTRPELGEQIAWGESNAIVFANSVLGARTNRYGDFMDLACAVVGKAPFSGLHTDRGRRATLAIEVDVPDSLLSEDIFYPALGLWIGANAGSEVPVIVGLDERSDEDRLKALGAAAASSGSTAMFHVVGVTPEAQSMALATHDEEPSRLEVDESGLAAMRRSVSSGQEALGAVSLGTPHMSSEGLTRLAALVVGARSRVPFYVNTSRDVLATLDQQAVDNLQDFGATVVTDTCTYITPIMGDISGAVMTDSGKWAYYAPANLGVEVVFGGMADCVQSAVEQRVVLSDRLVDR